MFCFFMGFFAFIPALIGKSVSKPDSFAYKHGTQALNLWLTEFTFSLALTLIAGVVAYIGNTSIQTIIGVRIFFFIAVFLWHCIHCIKGAIAAHHGNLYHPAFTINFTK